MGTKKWTVAMDPNPVANRPRLHQDRVENTLERRRNTIRKSRKAVLATKTGRQKAQSIQEGADKKKIGSGTDEEAVIKNQRREKGPTRAQPVDS